MTASPVNVLVVFYSCSGHTEKLALAAAVGAVQARGSIRLRRLSDSCEDRPEHREALSRMRSEYVPPAPADVVWADAVIVGLDGKIAGTIRTAEQATVWGRQITMETREFKDARS